MPKQTVKSTKRPVPKKTAAKKKTSHASTATKKRPTLTTKGPRRLAPAAPRRFGFHKPIKHPVKLPNVWRLTKTTAKVCWQHKLLFLVIAAWYAVLNLIFVQGLASNANALHCESPRHCAG